MNKDIAQELLFIVNDTQTYNTLRTYAYFRIEYLKNELVKADNIKTVTLLQGQIAEIKRLLTLKEEIDSYKNNN